MKRVHLMPLITCRLFCCVALSKMPWRQVVSSDWLEGPWADAGQTWCMQTITGKEITRRENVLSSMAAHLVTGDTGGSCCLTSAMRQQKCRIEPDMQNTCLRARQAQLLCCLLGKLSLQSDQMAIWAVLIKQPCKRLDQWGRGLTCEDHGGHQSAGLCR